MTVKSPITCSICETSSPKYKCPSCRTPYCSLNCCREHKAGGCQPLPSPETSSVDQNIPVNTSHLTEDSLPLARLENLKQSSSVRDCLKNPHLRHILQVIDKSRNPIDLIAQAMLEPIFVEFATECLKSVAPNENNDVL